MVPDCRMKCEYEAIIKKSHNEENQEMSCIVAFFKNIFHWRIFTGWKLPIFLRLADIGLEQYTTTALFVQLLTPTSFLVLIILQLHYFQKSFMQISDVNRFKK